MVVFIHPEPQKRVYLSLKIPEREKEISAKGGEEAEVTLSQS